MEISRRVLDLAREYNDLFGSGEIPQIQSFLDRTSNKKERVQLLIQLIASECEYGPFDAAGLSARFQEFPELRENEENQIEILRLIYEDMDTAGEELSWQSFASFGFLPERLCLRIGDEENYLGKRINDRYVLEKRLGFGGFGVVFQAHDVIEQKLMAIKIPHDRNARIDRSLLRHEGFALYPLRHPYIVRFKDFFADQTCAYLAMDYLDGGSLRQLVGQAPIDPTRAARILLQVSTALVFAHRWNIWHRDLKPENILLDANGRACVCDFGLARMLGDGVEKEVMGETPGTFNYKAPETLSGRAHVSCLSRNWTIAPFGLV